MQRRVNLGPFRKFDEIVNLQTWEAFMLWMLTWFDKNGPQLWQESFYFIILLDVCLWHFATFAWSNGIIQL